MIKCEESKVSISGTKVEVMLRKKRIGSWKKFASLLEIEKEESGGGESMAVGELPAEKPAFQEDVMPDLVDSEGGGSSDDDLSGIDDVEFD